VNDVRYQTGASTLSPLRGTLNAREKNMAQDYVHPLQALRAVMVQERRTLAESLLRSRKGAKAAKRRKKLIKLQKEIDVIDDAIADEQLLSPSLREQLAKERTSEENASGSVDMAVEPMERVKARLTELSERLTGSTTVSKPGAK
jgi:hypothetical protein